MLFYYIIILIGILIDQFSKWMVLSFLKPVGSTAIIPSILHLTYTENDGAAFSMLAGHQFFLILITLLFIIVIFYFFLRLPKNRRYFELNLSFAMILSGAISNLLDRIFRNFVVDFIDLRIIGFAIFNVADMLVVGGCILLIYQLFLNKELLNDDNDVFSLPGKKPQK